MRSASLIEKVIQQNGQLLMEATGSSMLPAIPYKSKLVIEKVDFGSIEVGDVVAFSNEDEIYVHRVRSKFKSCLITAGDNLPLVDPVVRKRDLVGRVVRVEALDEAMKCRDEQVRAVICHPKTHDLADVHLWFFVRDATGHKRLKEFVQRTGARVHVVRRRGIGLPRSSVVRLQAGLPPKALRIGVSPYATRPLADFPTQLVADRAREVHVLIGCNFGNLEQDGTVLLPPDIVDVHLRVETSSDSEYTATFLLGCIAVARAG